MRFVVFHGNARPGIVDGEKKMAAAFRGLRENGEGHLSAAVNFTRCLAG